MYLKCIVLVLFYSRRQARERPLRPVHPPPKRDPPPYVPPKQTNSSAAPPPYDPKTKYTNSAPAVPPPPAKPGLRSKLGLKISNPVLTGSTNKESQSHIQKNPEPNHSKPIVRPPPPKMANKSNKDSTSSQGANKPLIKDPDKPATGSASTSKFGPVFKIPAFSKAEKPASPKPEKKAEDPPVANIVKKRELTRDISNPILISTTDRRSKHLVKNEGFTVSQSVDSDNSLAPPVPAHVSLNRSESDSARRNRPLPPRPLSMPESECGEDLTPGSSKEARKSLALSGRTDGQSPRMPQRPPPPPVKPHLDNTRRTIEDELAKLDQIDITIPDETNDSDSAKKPSNIKSKEIKPKPRTAVKKTTSDTNKPVPPAKTPVAKTKSDTKPSQKPGQRPVFNPKARPGLSSKKQSSAIAKDSKPDKGGNKETDSQRKTSTDSLDEDTGASSANVSGITKMFEGQKKPLLGDKNVARTQSHGTPKAPLTPPKPKPVAKKIRSVDV